MPQLDTTLYIPQLFWLVVFFMLLFGAIYFFIEPRFQRIFHRRAAKINQKLKEIDSFKNETERLRLKAQQAEDKFNHYTNTLMRQTTDHINHVIQEAKESHHKKLIQELALFDHTLEKEHEKILRDLHSKENDFVQEILDKLIVHQEKNK